MKAAADMWSLAQSKLGFIGRPVALWLDRTPMYMVVVIALSLLVVIALGYGLVGLMPQTPIEQMRSLVLSLVVGLAVNIVCATWWKVAPNHISTIITILIVYFMVDPPQTITGLSWLLLMVALAMVSKYVIVFGRQHLVNPAAIGVALITTPAFTEATWWVAAPPMFMPLLITGGLVVYKMRRIGMVLTFLLVGYVVFLFEEWRFGNTILESWSVYWLSYPALFLACFMLTEPFTMPGTRRLQYGYGALVGILANIAVPLPWRLAMSPELALVLGNLAAYPFSLRRKYRLRLIGKQLLTPTVVEYQFRRPARLRFQAGQYLEWMLPHKKPDKRGLRRYFTIASGEDEYVIRLALKQPAKPSSFKAALAALPVDGSLIVSQRAGDFVLPKDPLVPIAFVAGGIGVTPFRSHATTLSGRGETRDIVTLYAAQNLAELAYRSELAAVGRVVPIVFEGDAGPGGESGYLSEDIIRRRVPDYRDRVWYVSGPPGMVTSTVTILRQLGVPKKSIHEDFFPGLA